MKRLFVFIFRIHFGGSEKSRFCGSSIPSEIQETTIRLLGARCTAAAGNLAGLLWQKNGLDVWQHTTLSDGHTRQQFVQLLVVADGQLQVTWDDASLLVVASGVAGQLENFSGQVLHHCGQVNRSSGTDSLGIVAFAKKTVDATDWELKTGTARSALCLSLNFASFTASRHCVVSFVTAFE
jgi:hypothetical protein